MVKIMNKKEILELRKTFRPEECNISRIATCYVTSEKEKILEKSQAFLSLPEEEAFKYFDILKQALSGTVAKKLNYAEGISQSKDSFYGEIDPDCSPVSGLLKERWRAWQRGNVMCSEMECAALFIVSSIRGKRAGAIMNWGDMNETIQTACDAVRLLIGQDKANSEQGG